MLVKTHLIVVDQYDEYKVRWTKRLIETKPKLNENGLPVFIVASSKGRIEVPTLNMNYLEKMAKKFTYPRGRGSITTDKGYIYIKEEDNEVLIGVVEHNHIRKYSQMYDEL